MNSSGSIQGIPLDILIDGSIEEFEEGALPASQAKDIRETHWSVTKWSVILEKIITELCKVKKLKERFSALTSNSARVRFCLNNGIVSGSIEAFCKVHEKSIDYKHAKVAAIFQEQAKGEFEKKNYLRAIMLYSRALAFAPEDEGATEVYDQRSVAFYQLGQYENALEDIERAFKLDHLGEGAIWKLLIRKVECLLKLGRSQEAAKLLTDKSIIPSQANTLYSARWSQLLKLSQITNRKVAARDVNLSQYQEESAVIEALVAKDKFTPHERFGWLNAKVDVHFTVEKGFHLIARKKLEFGEVVAVGKPFSGQLFINQANFCFCCLHCFVPLFGVPTNAAAAEEALQVSLKIQHIASPPVRVFAPVPCTGCPFAIYCSEYCRTKAWSTYHRFECHYHLPLCTLDYTVRLALLMLYSAGSLQYVRQVVTEWDNSTQEEERLEKLKDPRDYAFIYPLRQPDVLDSADALKSTITACLLVKFAQMSGFVPETPEDEHFAATVLLDHLLHLKTTCIKRYQFSQVPYEVLRVQGILGLMRPSCSGNICAYNISAGKDHAYNVLQSNVVVYYPNQELEAGTELSRHVLLDFTEDYFFIAADRNAYLRKKCSLICQCSQCEREQTDRLRVTGVYCPIACSTCGSLVIRSEGGPSEGAFRCSSKACSKKMPLHMVKSIYGQVDRLVTLFKQTLAVQKLATLDVPTFKKLIERLRSQVDAISPRLQEHSPFLANLYSEMFHILFTDCKPEGQQSCIAASKLEIAWQYAEKLLTLSESVPHLQLDALRSIATSGILDSMVKFLSDDMVDRSQLLPRYARFVARYEQVLAVLDYERTVAILK